MHRVKINDKYMLKFDGLNIVLYCKGKSSVMDDSDKESGYKLLGFYNSNKPLNVINKIVSDENVNMKSKTYKDFESYAKAFNRTVLKLVKSIKIKKHIEDEQERLDLKDEIVSLKKQIKSLKGANTRLKNKNKTLKKPSNY